MKPTATTGTKLPRRSGAASEVHAHCLEPPLWQAEAPIGGHEGWRAGPTGWGLWERAVGVVPQRGQFFEKKKRYVCVTS